MDRLPEEVPRKELIKEGLTDLQEVVMNCDAILDNKEITMMITMK